jgi:tetratricopeptide (TPR) repeat protein
VAAAAFLLYQLLLPVAPKATGTPEVPRGEQALRKEAPAPAAAPSPRAEKPPPPERPAASAGVPAEKEIQADGGVPARLPLAEGAPDGTDAGSAASKDAILMGLNAFQAGDYQEALSYFKQVEGEPGALASLGVTYYKLGQYENARLYLERSLEAGANEFMARKFLALAYYKLDDLEESVRYADAALAMKHEADLKTFLERVRREQKAQTHRVDEETLHFRVVFDGYEHGSVSRDVLGILEDAYRSVGRELDYFPEEPVAVVIYTEKDFFDITMLPAWTAGAFDGKIRLPIRGMDEITDITLEHVLYHEYVHALVERITRRVPLWLNEGLAEYLVPRDYFVRVGQLIPLRSLEQGFPLGDQRQMTIAYMQSYSAVSELVERYGLPRFKEMLFALGEGEDLNSAFSSAFFITYDEFVSTWGKEG